MRASPSRRLAEGVGAVRSRAETGGRHQGNRSMANACRSCSVAPVQDLQGLRCPPRRDSSPQRRAGGHSLLKVGCRPAPPQSIKLSGKIIADFQ